MRYSSVVLFVKDISKSVAFYTEFFDQEVVNNFGPCVGFTSGLALWQADHAARVTSSAADAPVISNRGGMELEFQAVDIESVFSRLQSAGVRMLHEVITQPWEQKAFRCLDPDGHLIEVGEDLAATAQRLRESGYTAERIAGTFGMPVEVVESLLAVELIRE